MKRFKIILVFVFLSQMIFAQDSSKKSGHEIGLNVNAALDKLFFNSANNTDNINDLSVSPIYSKILTYRYYFRNDITLRIGLGFVNVVKRDSQSSSFSVITQENSIRYRGLNIGFQKQFNISKKAQFYTGLDLKYEYEESNSELTQDFTGGFPSGPWTSNTDRIDNQYGLSIPIGIQFYLTKKISISTETNFDLYQVKSEEKFTNNSDPSNSNKSSSNGFGITIPYVLFINFKF